MKTTKADFELFKEAFTQWQHKLGLTQYRVIFEHVPLENSYAVIYTDETGKIATVEMCTVVDKKNLPGWQGPETHAKHEAIHLATHRLFWLGTLRYPAQGDLEEEWEALVRRLEKVLS